jgi:hypothetical protein
LPVTLVTVGEPYNAAVVCSSETYLMILKYMKTLNMAKLFIKYSLKDYDVKI